MSAPSRLAPRVCRLCCATPALRRTFASATTATETKPQWPQRQPRGEYYDILLRDPTPYASSKAEKPPSPAQASPAPPSTEAKTLPTTSTSSSPAKTYETISSRTAYSDSNDAGGREATAEERARVIFGSRLLGPAERADRASGRQAKSTSIAGVLVPPRPEEPDNCCMSGCVNCVWDLYREEMEEWTLKSNEAKKRLAESAAAAGVAAPTTTAKPPQAEPPAAGGGGVGGGVGGGSGIGGPASSMSAAGGGSETNWSTTGGIGETKIAKDMWTDDIFQNVPVGIREFMKQEKRLKEKHQREGTSGG